ncbi:hypothetical protein BOX15_Mlig017208g1 [Macrostomum lignano]|uniref:Luciferin 4-monooxygenase n=1 Tax=Macrostomum lignano TaxID=282301 RepID=A0A267F2Q4_9PLAT|nr:hypothetical protein BOX15_Mlig017208g1 [Macrostomum lignano]
MSAAVQRIFAGLRSSSTYRLSRSLASFRSPLPEINFPKDLSYPEYILSKCDRYPDRRAIVCANTGRGISYRDLRAGTASVASGLSRLGFGRGDVMCLYSHNFPEFPTAMYGIMSAGGILTTANPDYTAAELANQLKDCKCKFLLTTKDKLAVAAEAAKASGCVKEIFLVDDKEPGTRCFKDLLDDDGKSNPSGSFKVDQDNDIAAILYSSGTTGLPKGVMLSHRNLVGNVEQSLTCVEYCEGEKLIGVLPFYHVYGQVPVLAFTFCYGYEIAIMTRFDPVKYLETLQNYKLTAIHIVPPILLFMAAHPMVEKYDLSALNKICCAAAPLRVETEDAFRKKFPNIDLTQGWGMTEISPVGSVTPLRQSRWRRQKRGSVGLLVPNMEIRVVDPDTGKDLGPGETGQFLVRGINVMKGYYGNPKATAESIDPEGWFATGDVGMVDEDAYLFISDRLKELIKVKGLQVAPAELEALLLDCPDVADAGVVAQPDERAGELPVAFVVRREGSRASEADIQRWVAERVAPHKRLEGGVRFIDAVPKAASGKILRKNLRAMLTEQA